MATSLLKIGIQEKLFAKRWEMIHKVMGIYGIAPKGSSILAGIRSHSYTNQGIQ
jgi:hypothetical protein